MAQFKTSFHAFLMAGTALTVAGCQTTGNAWEDLKNGFSSFTQPTTSTEAAALDTECPHVTILTDLVALHQFSDQSARREENRISSVFMTAVQSSCEKNENNLVLNVDITFQGQLGPRGAASPSFSYPYFMAINDVYGKSLMKEVFATTIAYPDGLGATVTQHEKLRQIIPLNGAVAGQTQQVMLGLQLTDADMVYNRSLAEAALPMADRSTAPPVSLLGDSDPEVLAKQKAEDAKKAQAKKAKKKKKAAKPPLPKQKPAESAAPAVTATPEAAPAAATTTPAVETVPATPPADAATTTPAAAPETPVTPTTTDVPATTPVPAATETTPPPASTDATATPPAAESAPAATAAATEEEATPEPGAIPAMPTEPLEPAAPAGSGALDDLFDMTIPAEPEALAKQ